MTIRVPEGVQVLESILEEGEEVLKLLDLTKILPSQEVIIQKHIDIVASNLDKPDPWAGGSIDISADNFPTWIHYEVKRAK